MKKATTKWLCFLSVMYWLAILGLDAFVLLMPRPVNLKHWRGALWVASNNSERLIYTPLLSQKNTAAHSVFGVALNNQLNTFQTEIITIQWKPITYQETLVFEDIFSQQHNGIAKVQPCRPVQRNVAAVANWFFFLGGHGVGGGWVGGVHTPRNTHSKSMC